ncbi:hypothetical protein IQ276_025410 [Desmonostoc muscorum LEGE 12446]|uniref:Uncharacterized protein n=1 Tax=Desmonostoc muscorum LEGE 12446 TaxID=1828758 RepID=A0A8J7A3I9_DESMC|nr:hypothetical protein [Desmonostoc muscorum]MCF2149710.1 hypothetical protein [Desmonostoc muscorum LEGE 12446]
MILFWGSRTLNQYGDLLAIGEKSTNFDSGKLGIKVLQIPDGQTVCTSITSLDFNGNGQLLVSSYRDGTIAVWQQKKGLA